MPWTTRFITLSGGGTLWDPDPRATQPGENAVDGAAVPIPTTTIIGGQAWGDVTLVGDDGAPIPPGAFTVTVGFAKRTAYEDDHGQQFAWNRGELSIDQLLSIEQTQANMESPAMVILIVTDGTNTPGSGRIAIRVWEGQR